LHFVLIVSTALLADGAFFQKNSTFVLAQRSNM